MPKLEGLRGLGPKRLASLHEAGVFSVEDLLDFLPKGYLNAKDPKPLSSARPGENCLTGRIKSKPSLQYYSGRSIVRAVLEEGGFLLSALWFNQPWMARQLVPGQQIILLGSVREYQGKLSLINPKVIREKGITPQYRPLPGLPGKVFSSLVRQALEQVQPAELETLPVSFLHQHSLIFRAEAWRMAHFPENEDEIALAKRRLAFENLLLFQIALRLTSPRGQRGPVMREDPSFNEQFWEKMPFAPTAAQRRILSGIVSDMSGNEPMCRLVQGDVGSGKTAVAFGAALFAVQNGYQCALMAPTELLARQHYETAARMLTPFGVRCGLLTGSMRAGEKREALEKIKEGNWGLVIGTHALISQGVQFLRLGLVITDEQHRFGVRQRQKLAGKAGEEWTPHMLALSATPIPRSLALVLYGDLQVSVLDELPPGRQPVRTRIVPESRRQGLYRYIREKAEAGEQSYLVCPLVGESGESERKSALSVYQQLKEGPLRGVSVALVYGEQKAEEKESALSDFYSGRAKVLVSTTVIEVGMDVPEATTMVVEDADMFGLAQLHQLRGRVGRGKKESWCFLLGEPNERLETLTRTSDGFLIAEKDLELRGPGEFLGTRQHGRMLDAYGISDVKLIHETTRCLERIIRDREEDVYHTLRQLAKRKYTDRLMPAGIS